MFAGWRSCSDINTLLAHNNERLKLDILNNKIYYHDDVINIRLYILDEIREWFKENLNKENINIKNILEAFLIIDIKAGEDTAIKILTIDVDFIGCIKTDEKEYKTVKTKKIY